MFIPKGFFPVQDTGVIQAITQAPQSVSYASMAERQQALAAQILKNPDVESLTSFIGVDGSNITLNSGRMLINLKPRDDRSNTASEVIRQLQQDVAHIPGASLYMQPVQDLTIDSTVSPTQYQFMLTDPNISEFTTWVPKLVDRLKQSPELADVATDLQDNGQSVYIEIDRATASRFGITPATVDSALYDAFGQRIISTIFTQSNQYRVILEAQPADAALHRVAELDLSALFHVDGRPGAAVVDREVHREARAAAGHAPEPVPGHHGLVQPRARLVARRGGEGDRPGGEGHRLAGVVPDALSRARRWRSRRRCRTNCS